MSVKTPLDPLFMEVPICDLFLKYYEGAFPRSFDSKFHLTRVTGRNATRVTIGRKPSMVCT